MSNKNGGKGRADLKFAKGGVGWEVPWWVLGEDGGVVSILGGLGVFYG